MTGGAAYNRACRQVRRMRPRDIGEGRPVGRDTVAGSAGGLCMAKGPVEARRLRAGRQGDIGRRSSGAQMAETAYRSVRGIRRGVGPRRSRRRYPRCRRVWRSHCRPMTACCIKAGPGRQASRKVRSVTDLACRESRHLRGVRKSLGGSSMGIRRCPARGMPGRPARVTGEAVEVR